MRAGPNHLDDHPQTPTRPHAAPRVHTRVLMGMTAHAVTVECHTANGLPATTIVGLPQAAVRESRDRVASAIGNSGFHYPDGRVVINLAPGGLSKNSAALDLPIAISILAATGQVRTQHLENMEFLGELGLFGELRAVSGALACALGTRDDSRRLLLPVVNTAEILALPGQDCSGAEHLRDVAALLNGPDPAQWRPRQLASEPPIAARETPVSSVTAEHMPPVHTSFDQIIGQRAAKRALLIAAAGGHHVLMIGPPGAGKSMLARAFSELLPDLDDKATLEVAAIYSAAGLTHGPHRRGPFRDPHHSASATALMGGGQHPTPGEVTLAHAGVLFLDELPHFKPSALDLLREPIETGQAVIARAQYRISFPCRFQLIAAMNPCPDGRHCHEGSCHCSPTRVQTYQQRISGPLLDRIDLHVEVPAVAHDKLIANQIRTTEPQLAALQSRVKTARQRQARRQAALNAALSAAELKQHMQAAALDSAFLTLVATRYQLTARSFHKLWRVARTIADLEDCVDISLDHMTEAMSYRAQDWGARGFAVD